jgi:hypothetical protein
MTLRAKVCGFVPGEAAIYIWPARLYTMVARYYAESARDFKKAQNLYHHALSLASQCNSVMVQIGVLNGQTTIECLHGRWSEGL